jgi:hypothetical protein
VPTGWARKSNRYIVPNVSKVRNDALHIGTAFYLLKLRCRSAPEAEIERWHSLLAKTAILHGHNEPQPFVPLRNLKGAEGIVQQSYLRKWRRS